VTELLLGVSQASGGAGGLVQILPIFLMVGVFYLLIIRPQSKKQKLHQAMLKELKAGDDVVTTGGIMGRITGLKDEELVVQVQEGVRIRILRSAVQSKQNPAGDKK